MLTLAAMLIIKPRRSLHFHGPRFMKGSSDDVEYSNVAQFLRKDAFAAHGNGHPSLDFSSDFSSLVLYTLYPQNN